MLPAILVRLKFRLKAWNKDSVGSFKADMDGCLNRIKVLDLAEEAGGLSWNERVARDSLRKEFQLLAIKEDTL